MLKTMLPKIFQPYIHKNLCRIGDKEDGGYVISQNIFKKCKYLITCGVGNNFSFEKEFSKKFNGKIITYDHTVKNKFDFEKLKLFFFKENYKVIVNYLKFKLFFDNYKNIHKVLKVIPIDIKNYNQNSISIKKIIKKNCFLKIDIEGDEYRLLQTIIFKEKNILQLVIEFHNVDLFLDKIEYFIKKLKYLKLIHLHGCNYGAIYKNIPSILEMTFLNIKYFKDFNKNAKKKKFPINNLDYPNKKIRKDIVINFK
jgi:hypothetical protein